MVRSATVRPYASPINSSTFSRRKCDCCEVAARSSKITALQILFWNAASGTGNVAICRWFICGKSFFCEVYIVLIYHAATRLLRTAATNSTGTSGDGLMLYTDCSVT